MSQFWKPGDPPPSARSQSAEPAPRNEQHGLSGRTLTMRFMLRGKEAAAAKVAEKEKDRKEAAARWVARHGGADAVPAEISRVHAPSQAILRPRLKVTVDRDTTAPEALVTQEHGTAWAGRMCFGGLNRGMEATVRAALQEKRGASDVDDHAMEAFHSRVQGREQCAGGAGGKRRREEEGGGEEDGETAEQRERGREKRGQPRENRGAGRGQGGGRGRYTKIARKEGKLR